jgi:hypothetical protein
MNQPKTVTRYSFEVALAPYLVAAGDRARILVYRSVVMQDTDPAVQQVNDYIRECGMVLVSTKAGLLEGMFGNTEQSRYARPEIRDFDLAIERYRTRSAGG